jgi:hypothetical protein
MRSPFSYALACGGDDARALHRKARAWTTLPAYICFDRTNARASPRSRKAGRTYPGMRLFMETLEAPKSCRSRACRRAKACLGDKLQCVRDNREVLVNEVLPVVMGERPR